MYSLFDALNDICDERMRLIYGDDVHKKDVLTRGDIGTITRLFVFDIDRITHNGRNCLLLACRGNVSLCLIKYLIECCKMNLDHVDCNNDNCLTLACWKNTHLEVIKYLIEECRMNIRCVDCNDNNCLTLACRYNNLEVIKYLAEECLMNIGDITHISFAKFSIIVSEISKKYRDLNNLLLMGYSVYGKTEMKFVVTRINPLQLSDTVRYQAGIIDPYNGKFKIFRTYVDNLMCCIEPVFAAYYKRLGT